jgi:hypothetical protein
MVITIEEVETTIKEIFGESDILNTTSIYEKIPNEPEKLKLVIFFNKIFGEQDAIIYTKLIFVTDIDKINILNNSFLYLFDINCQYNNVEFEDIDELAEKLKNIITNQKFGKDIKILSEFIEKPSFLVNEWLTKNKINNFSVNSIKYNPKNHIIPCKSLVFTFDINVNNTVIELNISKINDIFIYSFIINKKNITIEKRNMNTLIETIGDVLKNNIK